MKIARSSEIRSDLVSLLRERLHTTKLRNPRFSLRAFAKRLGVDHSTLSQVLRGRRALSAHDLAVVGKRMGLSERAIREHQLVSKKRPLTKSSSEVIRGYQLDLDTFQLLSAWHHYAILELVAVRGFKADSRWIAGTLDIPVEEVNIALQRLLRLGLLEMAKRNRWVDKSGDAEFHSVALKEPAANQFEEEIHELAISAIKRVPSHHRVQRQMVTAFDSRDLSRVTMLADRFVDEVRSMAASRKSKDDVYQLEISFLPLTTLKPTKGDDDG